MNSRRVVTVGVALFHLACSSTSSTDYGESTHELTALTEPDSLGRTRRQAEVDAYVDAVRGVRTVVETTTLPNGDVLDWLAPEVGVDYSRVPPAPKLADGVVGSTLPSSSSATQVRSVLEDPGMQGPAGTIPFVRPRFEAYVKGTSNKASLSEYRKSIPTGTPVPGSQRIWAGRRINRPNKGMSAVVNAAWSPVDVPATDNFSIYQMNVANAGGPAATDDEWAGVAMGRIPSLMDNNFRMYLEFMTAGTGNTGDFKGGWAPGVQGFVTQLGTVFPPGVQFAQFSTINGTQYEGWFKVEWSSVCPISTLCTGAWWVWVRDQWAGYFPIGSALNQKLINFDLINAAAATVSFYGEVYDGTPGTWTPADMTSGRYPQTTGSSWQLAGYARNLQYRNSTTGAYVIPPESDLGVGDGNDPACYTQVLNSWADPWNRTMWFGGPGKTATNSCAPF